MALLDRSERHHAQCVDAISEIRGSLLTCEAVIAEACYLLRKIKGAPEAVIENVLTGVFEITCHLPEHAEAVQKLLRKYQDVPMDLADACLVAIADGADTPRVLTLDRDFEIYRWRSRRKFDIIVDF